MPDFNKKATTSILIIDDSKPSRAILQKTLDRIMPGSNYIQSASLKDAFDHIENNNIILIFIDRYLSAENNMEFIKKLKQNDDPTPIIICSSELSEVDIINFQSAGADSFLTKPFLPENVKKSVNRFIKLQPALG
ncbi:MAG: response regulator [Planctomycetes bacterium]|nr:response regulator [Planctomycetota bacterium]